MNKQQRDLLSLAYGGTVVDPAAFGEALKAAVLLFDKLPKDAHNNTVIPLTPTPLFNPKYRGTKWFAMTAEWIEHASDTEAWRVAWGGPEYDSTPVSEWYLDEKAAEIAHHLANGPHDHDHLEDE
jgi:hypothetical protein